MAIARYWRLNITATGGQTPIVDSMQLRNSAAGPNLATPGNGTASASSVSAGDPTSVAANAFDATTAYWQSNTSGTGWLQWAFGAGIDVNHLRLVNFGGTTTYNITAGSLDYSNDLVSWTKLISLVAMNAGASATNDKLPDPRGVANLVIPALSLAAFSGGAANATIPSITVSAFGGGNAALQMPAIGLSASASAGGNSANLTLPKLSLSSFGGGNATLALPALQLATTGVISVLGQANLILPSITVAGTGTVSSTVNAELKLSAFQMVGYSGAVCSLTLTNGITLQASGTLGSVGRAQMTLPAFEMVATGTTQNYGSADLLLPAIRMVPSAQAWLTLPAFTLTAIGSAVVTATYEAYALNLNHTPVPGQQQQPTDEMTRYTDFPFTHIVRYQNSYFGVAAGGLYLLEGTTDDGAEINYAVQTAKTDFGTPEKKTVTYVYFGGRLGAAETVTLFAGDDTPVAYNYTTPRGAAIQNYRQAFGRGIKDRYYAIGVSGSKEFELDTLDLNVDQLTRRI